MYLKPEKALILIAQNRVKLRYFIMIFTLIFLASCGTSTKLPDAGREVEHLKTADLIHRIQSQKYDFKDLTIQSKINANLDGISTRLNGKIYIKKGDKIWVNVSKFGVTGARALITKDGVKAYEKINSTYINGDFSYFNHLLKVDFIDYQKMENLLLGRIFVDLKPREFDAEIDGNEYVLNYTENQKLLKKPKPGKYFQSYRFDSDFRLKYAHLIDSKFGKELEIYYNNWSKFGGHDFPTNVKVLIKDTKTQDVELEYNNFTFEESATPFEIPKGYKLRETL